MSARRYSGDCRITVTILDLEGLADDVQYRGTVAWTENEGTPWARRHRRSARVGYRLTHGGGQGADHPAVYDEVARAALSFISHGDPETGEAPVSLPCAWDGDGPWVQRRPVLGRELPREYAKKIGR